MPTPNGRTRWTAPTPKTPLQVLKQWLQRSDVWLRVGLCAVTALILWTVTMAWAPSFPYRARQATLHRVQARVAFEYFDPVGTNRARENARRTAIVYYRNTPQPLNELRQALIDRIFQIKDKDYAEIDTTVWREFFDAGETLTDEEYAESFDRFRRALSEDKALDAMKMGVETAFTPFVKNGLLENLEHQFGEGSIQEIAVFSPAQPAKAHRVNVSDIRIAEILAELKARLSRSIDTLDSLSEPEFLADRAFAWLKPKLPVTLIRDAAATERSMRRAEQQTKPVNTLFKPGQPIRRPSMSSEEPEEISSSRPLQDDDIELLMAEHRAYVDQQSLGSRVVYTLADWGMYVAVFSLLWGYLYYRDRRLIDDLVQFATLLGLFLITIVSAWVLSMNWNWRAELVPLCMFAMIIAIAYHQELALLLAALAAMVFSISHGYGIGEFVVLTASCSVASLLCGRIRSRTRLVYVGLIAAAVTFPTTIGVGTLTGQPLGAALFLNAIWYAGCAVFSGLFMTAMLPFLEQWFRIETDISLLELSDASHPLLKQLVQRAPGTYNHSINVASIAEAAADAIGANGLLCRVGAYFHDIGKIRKPEYFIENQLGGDNKHDHLVPTMSTLVIVAHVKEGAEIAKRNHLPQRIIDIIEQHHGTTLVEYFYNQAAKKTEGDANAGEIEEADFRYPGPKPQSQEAGVTMLADAVESASRALRDPTPSRLENLVKKIVARRMDKGQFDECSLTLEQIHIIEDSLIKSLNAMYHARVKYPDQQPA